MSITVFSQQTPPKTEKDISVDIVLGEPRQFVEMMYSNSHDTLKSGVWECSAGTFRANYHGIVEFCHILEGEATITTSLGQTVTVRAGDGFVLDEGLDTEWTVDKFIKKQFFICAA